MTDVGYIFILIYTAPLNMTDVRYILVWYTLHLFAYGTHQYAEQTHGIYEYTKWTDSTIKVVLAPVSVQRKGS